MSPRILAADGREITEAEKWQTFEHINTEVEILPDEFVCDVCSLVSHRSSHHRVIDALSLCRDCWDGDR